MNWRRLIGGAFVVATALAVASGGVWLHNRRGADWEQEIQDADSTEEEQAFDQTDAPEWGQKLRDALADCDRVRVRSGGLCHRDREGTSERTLFDVSGKRGVSELVRNLAISAQGSNFRGGFRCGCCGNPTLEFYQGRQLVAAVGYHHHRKLRWSGWPSDGLLTQHSARYLKKTMRKYGVIGREYE